MVCIVSSTGRTIRVARSEAESSIPIGKPRTSAINTLASTIESVCSIIAHSPTTPTRHSISA